MVVLIQDVALWMITYVWFMFALRFIAFSLIACVVIVMLVVFKMFDFGVNSSLMFDAMLCVV